MGLQTDVRLGSHFHSFFIFFFIHFFYCRKMNLAISLGLILAAVMVTARMDKPGDETNNYVDKAAAKPAIPGDEEIVRIVRTIDRELQLEKKENAWDQKSGKKKKLIPKWRTRTKRTKQNLERSTMQNGGNETKFSPSFSFALALARSRDLRHGHCING